MNSSIRSIIRQFSTTVNSRKTSCFIGVHRMVNALKTNCFPLFCQSFRVTKRRVNWCLREFLHFLEPWMRAECQKTACSSAFTSWLTLKKHGVFLEENLEFDTYTPTFAPFLHLLLLHFDGILHALWKLLGGVVSKFSYVFIYSEFVAVPLLSQWHANDSILLTEGLDSLPDYVPSNKV